MAVSTGVSALTAQMENLNMDSNNMNQNRPPYISLRDAAETILPFDGKNMPVSQFANSCMHARNMISPSAEYGLVQMIKNKLVGPALRVALSGEYNDIDSLLTVLRTRFAPVYSSSQLHGELSKVSQHPDETVVDYGSRVSMILQQLKSCYQTESPNQTVQFLNSAENNAVRNFLTGLRSDIYTRINSRDPVNLNQAIETAIKAEAEHNEHMQRMRITEGLMQSIRCNNCLGYGHDTYSCSTINPLAQISHVQWQPKICSYCKNSGHTRAECKALQPQILRRNPVINQPPSRNMTTNNRFNQPFLSPRNATIICRYCKIPGHSLEQCRKRQYNNQRNNFANSYGRSNNNNLPGQGNLIRGNRPPENTLRERTPHNSGNQDRGQRAGAALVGRPQVRLITPEESREETPV